VYEDDPCTGMEPGCTCGFYAYLRGCNDYLERAEGVQPLIGGVIRGWGRTVVGTRGFRTERAEILALYVPRLVKLDLSVLAYLSDREIVSLESRRKVRERLRATYGVPVFTDWDGLLREFPPTEPEVQPEPQAGPPKYRLGSY
jgi:hypothetical protein